MQNKIAANKEVGVQQLLPVSLRTSSMPLQPWVTEARRTTQSHDKGAYLYTLAIIPGITEITLDPEITSPAEGQSQVTSCIWVCTCCQQSCLHALTHLWNRVLHTSHDRPWAPCQESSGMSCEARQCDLHVYGVVSLCIAGSTMDKSMSARQTCQMLDMELMQPFMLM